MFKCFFVLMHVLISEFINKFFQLPFDIAILLSGLCIPMSNNKQTCSTNIYVLFVFR